MTSILIVARERRLAETLRDHLRRHRFVTTVCVNPREAVPYLVRRIPDLLIVENCWPKDETREVLRQPQQAHHIPMIVFGSPSDSWGSIEALEDGADDFIYKPFSLGEMSARVRALIRRCSTLDRMVSA